MIFAIESEGAIEIGESVEGEGESAIRGGISKSRTSWPKMKENRRGSTRVVGDECLSVKVDELELTWIRMTQVASKWITFDQFVS